jgi:hypothetical protein
MTLAPPSCARWTKARRTPDLPIPAIPCTQITCVSPRRSSSRARSSASRPTKGTRRRWGTAVAMTAVSSRGAPRRKGRFRRAPRPRPAAWGAPSGSQRTARSRCHQGPEPVPSHPFSERRTEHVFPPGCHAGSRAATRPRTSRGRSRRSSAPTAGGEATDRTMGRWMMLAIRWIRSAVRRRGGRDSSSPRRCQSTQGA